MLIYIFVGVERNIEVILKFCFVFGSYGKWNLKILNIF